MSLEFLFGAIYAFAAAVMLWSLTQLNRFLAETRDIGDEVSLERFKALARVQMSEVLAKEYQRISGTWLRKASPDF
jgi:hypothetical protein